MSSKVHQDQMSEAKRTGDGGDPKAPAWKPGVGAASRQAPHTYDLTCPSQFRRVLYGKTQFAGIPLFLRHPADQLQVQSRLIDTSKVAGTHNSFSPTVTSLYDGECRVLCSKSQSTAA